MKTTVAIIFLMLLIVSILSAWATVSEQEGVWQTGFLISEFPAPFVVDGRADVLIVSAEATRESAEVIAASLQRYTTDEVPIISDPSYSEDLLQFHN